MAGELVPRPAALEGEVVRTPEQALIEGLAQLGRAFQALGEAVAEAARPLVEWSETEEGQACMAALEAAANKRRRPTQGPPGRGEVIDAEAYPEAGPIPPPPRLAR
jgi:hypothetical protein